MWDVQIAICTTAALGIFCYFCVLQRFAKSVGCAVTCQD